MAYVGVMILQWVALCIVFSVDSVIPEHNTQVSKMTQVDNVNRVIVFNSFKYNQIQHVFWSKVMSNFNVQ